MNIKEMNSKASLSQLIFPFYIIFFIASYLISLFSHPSNLKQKCIRWLSQPMIYKVVDIKMQSEEAVIFIYT